MLNQIILHNNSNSSIPQNFKKEKKVFGKKSLSCQIFWICTEKNCNWVVKLLSILCWMITNVHILFWKFSHHQYNCAKKIPYTNIILKCCFDWSSCTLALKKPVFVFWFYLSLNIFCQFFLWMIQSFEFHYKKMQMLRVLLD